MRSKSLNRKQCRMAGLQLSLIYLISLSLLALGCIGHGNGTTVNDRSPVITDDVKVASRGSNQFGNDLYQYLHQESGNLFFSPASITTALSMVLRGSEDETADQFKTILHVQLEDPRYHTAIGELIRLLNMQGRGYELRLANRLWGQHDFTFQGDFLEAMSTDYRAPLGLVDFSNQLDTSRQMINHWVQQQTNNRIQELFKPGMLDNETRLVLVNAIYFKCDWQMPFDKKKTRDEKFKLSSGEQMMVPMMHRTDDMQYGETEDARLLQLPYTNREMSMTVVLPKESVGLTSIEKKWLGPEARLSSVNFGKRKVDLRLPRFKVESEFSLNQVLQEMGLVRAFTPDAQFRRMSTEDRLMIGTVVHKAFVEVNEEGTEAAAATGVGMKRSMAPADGPVKFHVDQPFLFFIRHQPSQAVLFAGRVVDPR